MAPPSSPPSSGDEEKDSLLPPEAPPRSAAAAAAAAGSWRFAKIWTTSKLVYAAPAFATSGQALFNYIFTTKFYLDDMKLPPVRFALVSSVVRSLDLLLYPMRGYLLDNVRLKMGRRRPYFIFMAPLVGLTYFAMYSPPAGWGVDGVSVWFCVTFFANGFLPLTLPYMALGAEVTMDEDNVFALRKKSNESLSLVRKLSEVDQVLPSPRAQLTFRDMWGATFDGMPLPAGDG